MPAARASRLHFSTVLVLLVGFGLTAVLSLSARAVHNNNEDRLLHERVQEAGVLFTGVLPSRESPLAAAAAVAEATNGDRTALTRLLSPSVGTASGQYASASIWSTGSAATTPLLVLGARPELEDKSPADIRAVLGKAARANELSVVSFVDAPQPRIGYAFASQHVPSRYVAYTETNLPKDRQSRVIKGNDAFAGLDYAVYIGSTPRRDNLLTTSASKLPLQGRTSSLTVPFGDSKLLVVMSPTTELGGTLLARLQWLVLGFGVLFTLGAAALSERLVRRREQAVELAAELRTTAEENARLYAAQRSVAQTLQHSLLPEILPEIPGLTVGARYIAGTADIEIGGDWYDV
ncbi:MAG TPA: hypothetical protein VGI86_07240, partial [Acidimicrobiia bacterium]